MNKAHVTQLLGEYAEGALPASAAEKVKAHLSFCNACRAALADIERELASLKNTPPLPVPEGLESRVLTAVHRELHSPGRDRAASGSTSWFSWFTPLRGLTLAATCAVVVMVVRTAPRDFPAARFEEAKSEISAVVGKAREQLPLGGLKKGFEAPAEGERALKGKETADKYTSGGTRGEVANRSASAPAAAMKAELAAAAATTSDERRGADAPAAPERDAALTSQGAGEAGQSAPAPEMEKFDKDSRLESGAVAQKRMIRRNAAAVPPLPGQPLIGGSSAIETPLEIAVSSAEEWRDLWNRHQANTNPVPPLPPVDFETQQVIAIFAGQRPTGGYRVEITGIESTNWNGEDARVVRYRVVPPPEGVMTTQVISYPHIFSIQPRFSGRIFFEKID